jgi:ABC-type Na+ efflux pump permease subunit
VTVLVAVFSVMSGYFTVLIYEYAAAGLDKSSQTAVTRLLNIGFQLAAFLAVIMSVTLTSLGWFDSLIPTTDDIYM